MDMYKRKHARCLTRERGDIVVTERYTEIERENEREWGERGEEKKKPKRLFHLQLLLFYVYTHADDPTHFTLPHYPYTHIHTHTHTLIITA